MYTPGGLRVLTKSLEGAVVQIVSAGVSDVGRVRTNNEDSFRIVEAQNLFILSDGMGGEAHGEVASALAVETIAKYCAESEESKDDAGQDGESDTEPQHGQVEADCCLVRERELWQHGGDQRYCAVGQ